jgi:hypothetical protein
MGMAAGLVGGAACGMTRVGTVEVDELEFTFGEVKIDEFKFAGPGIEAVEFVLLELEVLELDVSEAVEFAIIDRLEMFAAGVVADAELNCTKF